MKERITTYVVKDKYLRLRSKLTAIGQTFTGWLNKTIDEFLEREDDDRLR